MQARPYGNLHFVNVNENVNVNMLSQNCLELLDLWNDHGRCMERCLHCIFNNEKLNTKDLISNAE